MSRLILFPIFVFSTLLSFAQSGQYDEYIEQGRYTELAQLLEKHVSTDSLSGDAFYKLGIAYGALHREKQSYKAYRQAALLLPDDVSVLAAFAKAAMELADYRAADSVYKRLYSIDTLNLYYKIQRATALYRKKEYREAFDLYYLLTAYDSSNAWFYRRMADCMQALDSTPRAVNYYKMAVKLDSTDKHSLIRLANIYHRLDLPDTALIYTDIGLHFNAADADFNKKKANLLMHKQMYVQAIPYYEKVLVSGDSTVLLMRQLGICYQQSTDWGHREKAIKILQRVLVKEPEDYTAAFYLGLALRDAGKTEESLEVLAKAADWIIPAQVVLYYAELANAQILTGQYKAAVQTLLKAYEQDPRRTEIFLDIGVLYETKLDDLRTALKYYEKFESSYTGNDKELKEYATSKIRMLKEELHFRGE